MATKHEKRTGLGDPAPEGVEGLFAVSEQEERQVARVGEEKSGAASSSEQSADEDQAERIKTSLFLSPETVDLLNLLKPKARKREGRFVSFGELIDTAIKELAEKMDVAHK